MKTQSVSRFEIINHGVEHAQYFQGCGISNTTFEDVATGCGSTEKEALDDALDSLAQNGWDVEAIDQSDEYTEASDEMPIEIRKAMRCREDSELYVYVSVRVSARTAIAKAKGEV